MSEQDYARITEKVMMNNHFERRTVEEIIEIENQLANDCGLLYCPQCGHDLSFSDDGIWTGKFHNILAVIRSCWCDRCGWENEKP